MTRKTPTSRPPQTGMLTVHLCDLQGLAPRTALTSDSLGQLWTEYEREVGLGDGDQLVVASRRVLAARTWFAAPMSARRLVDPFPAHALADAVDLRRLRARGVQRLVIAGGGADLSALAERAQDAGLLVHHVFGAGGVEPDVDRFSHARTALLGPRRSTTTARGALRRAA